jgi:hypothetical protein
MSSITLLGCCELALDARLRQAEKPSTDDDMVATESQANQLDNGELGHEQVLGDEPPNSKCIA